MATYIKTLKDVDGNLTLPRTTAVAITIDDTGSYYTSITVEDALQEIGGILGNLSAAASDISIVDSGSYFTGTNVETALQEIATTKAPIASPTFTGTVSGITAAMVGALPLAGGTMTGSLTTTGVTINATAAERHIMFNLTGRNTYFYGQPAGTVGLWDSVGGIRWSTDTSSNFTAAGNITAYSDVRLKN